MVTMVQLGGWCLVLPGLVGLGWVGLGLGWVGFGWVGLGWVGWLVGKNAWCNGCHSSVEVLKLVFSQVAFVFLMFEVCFFLMFFGHLFRVCWSLFSPSKKIPEKDDLKFRHQNVGEF